MEEILNEGKYQHYVPRFYFRLFSKDKKSISMINISNRKFIPCAKLYNQCAEDYFYSKNTEIEKVFSQFEATANKILKKIVISGNISDLSEEEKISLRNYVSFQHGRTKYAFDREDDMANYIFNLFKPKIVSDALAKGEKLSLDDLKDVKIKTNGKNTTLLSLISGILLDDLKIVLLDNQTPIDFIFSDNPIVFFNSFFNDIRPHGTTGLSSTGLQIFFPINSRYTMLLYDSSFYEIEGDIIKIQRERYVKKLNDLQIIHADRNLYFENHSMELEIFNRINSVASKIPKEKNEYEIMGSRIAEDGTYRKLLRTSAPKIKYNLKNISFFRHKNTIAEYGVRNQRLIDVVNAVHKAFFSKKVKSTEELNQIIMESLKNTPHQNI